MRRTRLAGWGAATVVASLLLAVFALGAGAGRGPAVVTGFKPESPDVQGTRMVWSDLADGSYDVFLYDSETGSSTRVASSADDEVDPVISGTLVVYTRWTEAGADIYAYDISSGTTTIVTDATGDQTSPAIAGTFAAWIDHSSGYHGALYGRDITLSGLPTRIDSGYSAEIGEVKAGGDWLVYQIRPGGLSDDPDVRAYNVRTAEKRRIAETAAYEMLPDTDGRYVAWADSSAGDMDIKGHDLQTGETVTVRMQAGEQTLPAVGDGRAYWIDNTPGKRLHVDTYDFAKGKFSAFDNRTASDMVAVSAAGGSVAWLEPKAEDAWQIKAYFAGSSQSAGVRALQSVASKVSSAFSLARISTGGDDTAPTVADASVSPGEVGVDSSADIVVRFSEPLDAASVDGESVKLTAEDGRPVEASVRYSSLAGAVIVDPAEVLPEGTYTLEVGSGVSDKVGNSLQEPLAVTFGTGSTIAADTVRPTKPGNPVARVSGLSDVELTWIASADDVGVAGYDVYRYSYPGVGQTLVGSAGGAATSLVFPKAADETTPKKYTYYYAVQARDAAGNLSTMSLYTSPDPHGTYIFGQQVNNCSLCHSVHAGTKPASWWSLGAQSAGACYLCHGNTAHSTAYGAGSTLNAQALFWDYSATPLPSGGSRHRNDYMLAQRQECDACHTPHRKPYNEASGVYDPATSYSKLLKRPSDPADAGSALVYSTDAVPFGKEQCFACHGSGAEQLVPSPLTFMTEKGGASAYSNTAGDHNQAGFDAAGNPSGLAHDDEVVQYTLRPGSDPGPLNSCTACHNEHAAASAGLIDYRQSGTSTNQYDQAGLCYACHSATSSETRSVGSAPFAWNGRDVKAQFTKASKHPVSAQTGAPTPEAGSWLQTTEADFGSDVLNSTVVVSGGTGVSGAVELAPSASAGATIFSDDFESGGFANWDSSSWGIDNNAGNAHGGTYSAVMNTTSSDELLVKTVDTAGRTNVQISFWLMGTSTTENTDYVRLQVYNTGTATWDTIRDIPLNDRITSYRQFTDSIPASYYSSTMQFRILGQCNMTDEYQHVDDVQVTADPLAGSYVNDGNVVSTPIAITGGTLNSWNTLSYSVNQPSGSTIEIDVLDAGTDTVLIGGLTPGQSPYPLSTIDEVAHPTLKLRARMTGDGTSLPSVSDDFDDNSFDTAKWNDAFINSTDPDSGTTSVVWNGNMENWSSLTQGSGVGWTTNPGNWEYRTNQGDAAVLYGGSGDYMRHRDLNGTFDIERQGLDLSGYSSATIDLYYVTSSFRNSSDHLQIIWQNANGTWTLLDETSNRGTRSTGSWQAWTYTLSGNQLASNSTLRVRMVGSSSGDSNQTAYVDEVYVRATASPTNNWPQESGGTLTLRAEGADFWNAADEGEFLYIDPAAYTWISGNDFDVTVQVPSYNNLGGNGWMKTGLMLRTGADEGTALAAGAKMVGLYVTDTNGISFQYRDAVSANSINGGGVAGDAPKWLKIERRGNTVTGYAADASGGPWTSVGSTSVAMDSTVLAGICLTSHVNDTYSEATFDSFSLAQVGGTSSSVTPRLDDWTVDYTWTPSPTGNGAMTCYNCHNTHYVTKGTAGAVWQMSRASDPDNTKSSFTGAVDAFCLKCHDSAAPTAITNSASTLVPYSVIMTDMSAYPFFSGWNKKDGDGLQWANSGHKQSRVDRITPGCESCHDPHASDNQRLTAATAYYSGGGSAPPAHVDARRNNSSTYAEENLCYVCHLSQRSSPNCTGGACHTDIDSLADVKMNVQTAFSRSWRHPIGNSGLHSDTEDAAGLGATNRHAECVDCHDPHMTKPGKHTVGSANAGNVLLGAKGIKPTYGTSGNWQAMTGQTIIRINGDGTDDYEAYVCFKCHSAYSGQPFNVTSTSGTNYTSTDLALEFNPANDAGHNVVGNVWPKTSGLGPNNRSWSLPTDTSWLRSGWTRDSMLTCSDCHAGDATSNGARGPHGSSVKYILDANYPGDYQTAYIDRNSTNGVSSNIICSKCHVSFDTMNNAHREHDDRGSIDARCTGCHIKIPHGWKRPRLLGYRSDDPAYSALYLTNLTDKDYTGSWNKSDCGQSGCGEHNTNANSPLWP